MKKIKPSILGLIYGLMIPLIMISCIVGCQDKGTSRPLDVTLKMGSREYIVTKVTVDDMGTEIYVIYPKDSTLEVPIQTTYQNGKVKETVVILNNE